jgi:hypothetical protein
VPRLRQTYQGMAPRNIEFQVAATFVLMAVKEVYYVFCSSNYSKIVWNVDEVVWGNLISHTNVNNMYGTQKIDSST